MAEFGREFAYACLWMQLLGAFLLTPILTAGAITEERGRRTLDFLLLTHLHDREIVVGKLVARVAHVALIILTGLPLLGLVQLFGGVDPNLVLAAFVGTLMLMISVGSVSLYCSVRAYNTPQAIMQTYFFCFCYFAASMVCLAIPGVGWLSDGNPLAVAIRQSGNAGAYVTPHGLPEALLRFVGYHLAFTILFCRAATRRLRRHLDEPHPRLLRALREDRSGLVPAKPKADSSSRSRPSPWPTNAGNLLWRKEMKFESFRPYQRRDNALFVVITAFIVLNISWPLFVIDDSGGFSGDERNMWTRTFGLVISCFLILAVSQSAARTFSRERTRRTLDSLLATPLENRAILASKMFGAVYSVRWAWLLPGIFWACAVITGGLSVLAMPFLIVAWFVYAVMIAEVGVWCSLASRNTLRANIFTLAILAGIFLLPLVLALAESVLNEALGAPGSSFWSSALWSRGLSPPLVIWDLAFTNESLSSDNLPAALVGLAVYAVIAWLLWRRLNTRFGRMTGRMPIE
jgi:ABC-type transport system involved in multi-copper enzyme maturation permease subunit